MNSFYTRDELENLGFKKIGDPVFISRKASFYDIENITLGSHVRIDDFCILSGKIKLGSYIHISAYSALFGKLGIDMEDYTGLSPRCTLFSASDDFSGEFFISPMVDNEYTNVQGGKILIRRFSQIGSHSIVLPAITINEGVVVGAISLVNKSLDDWSIYAGVPARFIKKRSQNLLNFGIHNE